MRQATHLTLRTDGHEQRNRTIRELLAVRDTGTCVCEPAEALLRRHVAEIGTEIQRLAALRADLLAMLAAMPGPYCPDPLPGAWCPPSHSSPGRR